MYLAIVFVFISPLLARLCASPIDCSFDSTKNGFCRWKREWIGAKKSAWRIGNKIRRNRTRNHRFAIVKSRSRSFGFHSSIRSPSVTPQNNSCFVFWWIQARKKKNKDHFDLKLYTVNETEATVGKRLIWKSNNASNVDFKNDFRQVVVPLNFALGKSVQFIFEVTHGKSKSALFGIDDIGLRSCENIDFAEKADLLIPNKLRKESVQQDAMLAARRPKSSEFQIFDPDLDLTLLTNYSDTRQKQVNQNLHNKSSELPGNNRRSNTNKQKKHFEKPDDLRNGNAHGNLALKENSKNLTDQTTTKCNFLTYTGKLQKCFRQFFFRLRRRQAKCRQSYKRLESCVKFSATSCVLSSDFDLTTTKKTIVEALRNTLKTKKVFCEEEGAFVFPKFSLNQSPIQCSYQYLIRLKTCSASFTEIFNSQQDDSRLCSEYSKASECQRQTTAQECSFNTQAMLLYGLNLQYQFAHNPFCPYLTFSK